ncbi:hypothetical protein C7T35_31255 [Variovorax sp. WS11]|uniref:hypothetical protein n=1 Tax=Variovorax sp. WS11 TaxID=1105204 RepID=UPI000D0CDCBF|nr:hypothetical protein [Variovorax sp. WS11]NDZ15844.1 hypothetical protein [Variovorax sp. WS11]PSL80653.1 hypothetical protein C7T35_31255 [Variovorax sp. WS11]
MHAIEYLIGPFSPSAEFPQPGQPWVLCRNDGVTLHLLADGSDEQLMLGSSPGSAEDYANLSASEWRHRLPHPRFPGLTSTIAVTPGTGLLRLIDEWHRHAIERHTFEALVEDHARRHLQWRELLESPHLMRDAEEDDMFENDEDEDEDEDEDLPE